MMTLNSVPFAAPPRCSAQNISLTIHSSRTKTGCLLMPIDRTLPADIPTVYIAIWMKIRQSRGFAGAAIVTMAVRIDSLSTLAAQLAAGGGRAYRLRNARLLCESLPTFWCG
jgi:hypothetical protein